MKKRFLFCRHNFLKKIHLKLSENEPVCICKEGWCAGLEQEEGCLHEQGKMSEIPSKEGRWNKSFLKVGGNLGQGVGASKRGGWKALTNCGHWLHKLQVQNIGLFLHNLYQNVFDSWKKKKQQIVDKIVFSHQILFKALKVLIFYCLSIIFIMSEVCIISNLCDWLKNSMKAFAFS